MGRENGLCRRRGEERDGVVVAAGIKKTSGGVGGDTTETGAVINEWLVRVDFPWATQKLMPDMVVEITKSGDPNLVGHKFRLVSPQSQKTHATAQRWNVKEAQ